MMDKTLLEKIQDLNYWHKAQDSGVERTELADLLRFSEDKEFVLAITGLRRSGKTYLAKQLLKEKIKKASPEQTLYINFEDPALEPYLSTGSLTELYNAYRYYLNKDKEAYVVLDEVQNVPKWEKWVRIMLEKRENVKFIITGSSSKFFKGELSKALTGRAVNQIIFPLSFKDFLNFKKYDLKAFESYSSLAAYLNEYLEYGGLPLVVLSEQDRKNTYLKELFEDIITKDIIIKYALREPEIKKLAVLLLNNYASYVSVRKMRNIMETIAKTKISPTSVNNYLYYLEDAHLFFFIPIFSYKIKDAMLYPRKAYCIDTGFINAINSRYSENIGRTYENTVAAELLRRNGKESIFYWKSQKTEVDFAIKEGQKITELIQVAYSVDDPKTKEREVNALIEASEELDCDNLMIITEKQEADEMHEGKKIKYVPLWKWLLDNKAEI